jgi:glutamine amidotransferase
MCRLLYVRSEDAFSVADLLTPFADVAKNSKEYQGHGWGCAYVRNGEWQIYRHIEPIWKDDERKRFGTTKVLVAHARSAFENRDIKVENNMPFNDDKYVFIFNGELRGVRLREEGRIGAEKIFNFIKRFDKGDLVSAVQRAFGIIEKRSTYVRAMNLIIADSEKAVVGTYFNEDPDYFTLRSKKGDKKLMLCSEPFPGESGWTDVPNRSIRIV